MKNMSRITKWPLIFCLALSFSLTILACSDAEENSDNDPTTDVTSDTTEYPDARVEDDADNLPDTEDLPDALDLNCQDFTFPYFIDLTEDTEHQLWKAAAIFDNADYYFEFKLSNDPTIADIGSVDLTDLSIATLIIGMPTVECNRAECYEATFYRATGGTLEIETFKKVDYGVFEATLRNATFSEIDMMGWGNFIDEGESICLNPATIRLSVSRP